MPKFMHAGSCATAGYTECCEDGVCLGSDPFDCFCDQFCSILDDCCYDIDMTCTPCNESYIYRKREERETCISLRLIPNSLKLIPLYGCFSFFFMIMHHLWQRIPSYAATLNGEWGHSNKSFRAEMRGHGIFAERISARLWMNNLFTWCTYIHMYASGMTRTHSAGPAMSEMHRLGARPTAHAYS